MKDKKTKSVDEFWKEFLHSTGKDPDTKYIESFHFDLTEQVANKLLGLVLAGIKKATASSLYAWEKEDAQIPQIGDYSIITDWGGHPHCVIETTQVTILPYNEITFEICKREGEDDNLESWQRKHRRFFIAEGESLGYRFDENMPVVFEDFEVVYAPGVTGF